MSDPRIIVVVGAGASAALARQIETLAQGGGVSIVHAEEGQDHEDALADAVRQHTSRIAHPAEPAMIDIGIKSSMRRTFSNMLQREPMEVEPMAFQPREHTHPVSPTKGDRNGGKGRILRRITKRGRR